MLREVLKNPDKTQGTPLSKHCMCFMTQGTPLSEHRMSFMTQGAPLSELLMSFSLLLAYLSFVSTPP